MSRGCGGDERVGASLVSGGRGAGVDACTLARKEQQLQNADKRDPKGKETPYEASLIASESKGAYRQTI